eukprot:TRINITY_DN2395_c0_g1_i4.p1 TRINITY_DN2395_c0_g1~~TRINITY_DN2395_c0_g1_i4.p1  ORF type:complete len:679 (-),score=97.62 TRINITY_DN2395_c0_g1_i4:53-2089(-)
MREDDRVSRVVKAMLRSGGDARPGTRRHPLRGGDVFVALVPLAIAAPFIRFTIKGVWDLPAGSLRFPRFASAQEPELCSCSDCTDNQRRTGESLDTGDPVQGSILVQQTAVRSRGFDATGSDATTEEIECNRWSGFGRAQGLESSLDGDTTFMMQNGVQVARMVPAKGSMGDASEVESVVTTDVLATEGGKMRLFGANASAANRSDLIEAAATDLRTVASHVETMATNSAAKGSGSAGVGKEDATVKLERSTEKQEIEKAKKISKGHVDADVAVSQIAHLPKVEISATTFLSLVETVRSRIRRLSIGSEGEVLMTSLLFIMIGILAAGAFTAYVIVHSQPSTPRETMGTGKDSGVLAFNRGEQLGRTSSGNLETTDGSPNRQAVSNRQQRDPSYAQHDRYQTLSVNRIPTATGVRVVDQFGIGHDVVDHRKDTMPYSSWEEAGALPAPKQSVVLESKRWVDGPAAATSSHLKHHLCEELVIPKKSECMLYIPPLKNNISAASVCVENVEGLMMFRAYLDNSRGLGSSATSSVQSTQLLLTDAVGSATFASCTPNVSDVQGDGETIGHVTSLTIRDHSGLVAGELYPTADGPGHYEVLMTGGWGLYVQGKENDTWRISDLKRRRLMAMLELPQFTSPRTGAPRKNERLVTIGHEVDVGLIILTVVSIDWFRVLQNKAGF